MTVNHYRLSLGNPEVHRFVIYGLYHKPIISDLPVDPHDNCNVFGLYREALRLSIRCVNKVNARLYLI
jgi:hypothetical protein